MRSRTLWQQKYPSLACEPGLFPTQEIPIPPRLRIRNWIHPGGLKTGRRIPPPCVDGLPSNVCGTAPRLVKYYLTISRVSGRVIFICRAGTPPQKTQRKDGSADVTILSAIVWQRSGQRQHGDGGKPAPQISQLALEHVQIRVQSLPFSKITIKFPLQFVVLLHSRPKELMIPIELFGGQHLVQNCHACLM
jgi:hypothetical protein